MRTHSSQRLQASPQLNNRSAHIHNNRWKSAACGLLGDNSIHCFMNTVEFRAISEC